MDRKLPPFLFSSHTCEVELLLLWSYVKRTDVKSFSTFPLQVVCSRWLLLSSSGRWGPEAAWRPRRTLGRWGYPSVGCTSLRAASAAVGRRGRGTGWPGPGGENTRLTEALRKGGASEPGVGGNTAGTCRTPACARPPTVPCEPGSPPGGGASGRPAPASAAWLFCSETTPADTRRSRVRSQKQPLLMIIMLAPRKLFAFLEVSSTFVQNCIVYQNNKL